jgi:hypothetical protein
VIPFLIVVLARQFFDRPAIVPLTGLSIIGLVVTVVGLIL